MGIQATEYNSLYFNQIRVLCTGSAQREICWANVNSDRPQQARWLVVAQMIVLFVPLFVVDLLHMLWMHFDAWKRGIPVFPPLSVSSNDIRKISGSQRVWEGEALVTALRRTSERTKSVHSAGSVLVPQWASREFVEAARTKTIVQSAGVRAGIVFLYLDSVDGFQISDAMNRDMEAAMKETLEHNEKERQIQQKLAERTQSVVQQVGTNAGIVFSFLDSVDGFQISDAMNRDMEAAMKETLEHNEKERQIRRAQAERTQNVVQRVDANAGIVFSYLSSVDEFEISEHMSWNIEMARRETWKHNGVWKKIQQEENTPFLEQQISANAAAIALSFLDESELGELGNFLVSARMRNQIQNAKDDTWLHNLCRGIGGYIKSEDFCKIPAFAKRSDFAGHISRLSRQVGFLHVCKPKKLDHKAFIDGFSYLSHIRELVVALDGDLHDDTLAQSLKILNSQLELFKYSNGILLPKIAEALKSHCSNIQQLSLDKISSQAVGDLLPYLKKVKHLEIWPKQGIQKELLEVMGNHLSSLTTLHLSSDFTNANADFPVAEFEQVLTNNRSLKSLLLYIPFSSAMLDAIHTCGTNLEELSLWMPPKKGDLLFKYYQEAPMSTRLGHLTGLTFSFKEELEISFAVFQQMMTSLMNRYPELKTLHLFDLSILGLTGTPTLLRPGLSVSLMRSGSINYIRITSAGISHR